MIYQTENFLTEQKDKIQDEDKQPILDLIEDAKKIKDNESSSKDDYENKANELQTKLTELYQKM
jgi:molecular chaperone DnaK (HSP70)